MATITQIVEESFKNSSLAQISTTKWVEGIKIIHKERSIFIPMGLANKLEKVRKISNHKDKITFFTDSDKLVLRTIDLKHHVTLFKIL